MSSKQNSPESVNQADEEALKEYLEEMRPKVAAAPPLPLDRKAWEAVLPDLSRQFELHQTVTDEEERKLLDKNQRILQAHRQEKEQRALRKEEKRSRLAIAGALAAQLAALTLVVHSVVENRGDNMPPGEPGQPNLPQLQITSEE